MNKNQKGFTAIEGLLILIIVGLIGFVGWYVNNAKSNTDKTLNSANNISSNAVPAKIKSPAITTSKPSSDLTTFKIPELAIQIINVPSSISDLTYYEYPPGSGVDPNNTLKTPVKYVAVKFSTDSLTLADPACSAKTGSSIGLLEHTDGTYMNNEPVDNSAFVKQFSGFYITYGHPESICSNTSTAESLHKTQTATFETLVNNAADIQLIQ